MRLRSTTRHVYLSFALAAVSLPLVGYVSIDAVAANIKANITVLVYSHGDNDLDGSLVGPGDLNEMVKQAENVNFVVYHDRAQGQETNDAPHLDLPLGYTGGYVFRVGSDGKALDAKPLGEPYTMDPQTLSWFVYYGLTTYPADTTFLILDDHGGGPNAYFGSEEIDTPDSDPRASFGPMSLNEVTAALRSGINQAVQAGWKGGSNGRRLDALINATCINGNLEVYRELSPLARYAYGSEEVTVGTPSLGFWDVDYSVQPPESSEPDAALTYLKALTASAPDVYRTKAAQLGQPRFEAFAHAIFDLDHIPMITAALKNFVDQVRVTNGYPHLIQARSTAMGFGRGTGEPDAGLDLYDFGDLLARIPRSAPPAMLTARDALVGSIAGARRHLAAGGPYAGASGISIYFPPRRSGVNLNYQRIPDPTGWIRLIRDLKVPGTAELGPLTLKVTTVGSAWKSDLSSQVNFPQSASGSIMLGADGGSLGVRIHQIVPATVGAGGPKRVQGVGTYHTFTFGSSLTSPRFSRDLSSVEFEAILTRAGGGSTSEIVVSHAAKFKAGTWTFGPPQFLQVENGARATIRIAANDIVSPITNFARVVATEVDPSTGDQVASPPYLSLPRIVQPGVNGNSRFEATPIRPGSPLIILANLFTDTYEVDGDIVIEQLDFTRP